MAVRLSCLEPELAIVIFPRIFPGRNLQIEHCWLPLHMPAQPGLEMDLFLRFSREAGLAFAEKAKPSFVP